MNFQVGDVVRVSSLAPILRGQVGKIHSKNADNDETYWVSFDKFYESYWFHANELNLLIYEKDMSDVVWSE